MIRRNEVSQSVLQEVVLSDEDTGCDVQFQHDYLFILGDLNYRLNPSILTLNKSLNSTEIPSLSSPSNILFNVTSATFMERGFYSMDDTNWYQRKYRIFDGPLLSTSSTLSQSEQQIIQRNEEVSHDEWLKVLASDEMLYWMKAGEIFYGFKEIPIRFPPTYKRKKGYSGYCGDYTNYGEVIQGFSNLGDQEEEEKDQITELDTNSQLVNRIENDVLSSQIVTPQHQRNRSDITSLGSTTSTASSNPFDSTKSLKPARRATLFTLTSKTESFEEKRRAKIRPPSYTDRIIYHSLCPDDGKLHSLKYGFCDTLRASDHRPVVMTMQLEVNQSILPSSRIINTNSYTNTLNTHVIILQLTISQLTITLTGAGTGTGADDEQIVNPILNSKSTPISQPSSTTSSSSSTSPPISIKNVQVIFPISPKDPLLHYRKIYDMSKALHVNDRTGLTLNHHHKSTQLREELLKSKKVFSIQTLTSRDGIKVRDTFRGSSHENYSYPVSPSYDSSNAT